jgi:predicted ribosomally synthesized peptide with nif11-like leader
MSKEAATALYERVNSDEEFRIQLEAAETPEEKRRIVTEAGYELSRDDLSTVRKLAGVSDLSDEDLEKVSGGMFEISWSELGLDLGEGAAAAIAAVV